MILRNSFIQARVDLPTSPWVVDRHFQPFWEEESQDKWVVDLTEEEEAPSEFWLKMGWNGVNSSPKDSRVCTMYDFHDSTDTLKFGIEKRAINITFLFFIWFWWNLVKL